ncbi:zinc ribbon domain-containing protein, partial [Pseudoalteromonas sp. MelDa3]
SKCNNNEFDTGEIRVSGGFWSRIFDVQNKKYTAVTCSRCSFTEFYKGSSSTLGNVFDFFTG